MLLLLAQSFAGVLVNEVYYDPDPESDGGNEWIELCNNGTESVDLTGWTIESGGGSFETSFTLGALTLAPGSYVVIGGTTGDLTGEFKPSNLQNGGSETDGVRILSADGTVIDTVLYDTDSNTNGLLDDLGTSTSLPAPDVSGGHSIARWNGSADCTDTDVSGVDFLDYEAPSPGAANPEPPVVDPEDTGDTGDTGTASTADCTSIADIRLNELLSNPAGSDDGLEWIELYNRGTAPVDVSGWIVRGATKSTGGNDVALPEGTIIEALGFLVVGAGGTVTDEVSLGNGTNGDGAYLVCGDYLVDSVVYGDSNGDNLFDDSGVIATSLAVVPGEDVSLARRLDGVDTDLSGDDWTESSSNTPGSANITPQCDATGGEGLKVNEVLYDSTEDDATYEFVELYNAGTSTINLEGFVVEAAKSSWATNATLEKGASLAPGEFYVVGGGDVDNQDYSASKLDLGNGTDGDGVRVLDCTGVVLDTVLYGGAEGDGLTGDGGATDVVDKVSAGTSIGRYADGEDSDQHTDWHPDASPTPGEANSDPGATEDPDDSGDPTGGDTGVDPIGCGTDPDRPDGAECNAGGPAGLPLHGLELAVAAIVLARRRKA
ncbi:hypothetical protein LBMAG42_22710 [Deltaproteobacteria bacterium]|nr:hypothetical protein LBMAG42_22710 [Deltaproteobacteria bacterium]